MILATILTLLSLVQARPPANVEYLHNISLIYDGDSLQNLDSIDSLSDVPAEMAQSLKDAIIASLPSYLEEMGTYNQSVDNVTLQANQTNSSTAVLNDIAIVVNENQSETETATSDSNISESTIQPSEVDTTTDFWSRTDLVHFHVDIEMSTSTTTMPPMIPAE